MYAKLNNIKIYLTWSKFVKDSLAIREAMNELGGILAIWEYAFEGHINTTTQIDTDLYFSNFSYDYFHSNNSTIDYFINTGFLTDFRFNILKKEAMKTRLSLKENGAKYIIAIFDENSNDYKKWHTGLSLQIENYEFILKHLFQIF